MTINTNTWNFHKILHFFRSHNRRDDAIAIAPAVWYPVAELGHPYPGARADDDVWVLYICGSHDTAQGPEFHVDRIVLGTVRGELPAALLAAADTVLEFRRPNDLTREEAEAGRRDLAAALREDFASVRLFDDDLACLQFCARRWPGEKVEALATALAAERAQQSVCRAGARGAIG